MRQFKNLLFVLIAVMMFTMTSCNDDSDFENVPNEVSDAFKSKFPDAKDVSCAMWGDYAVFDFEVSNRDAKAWYKVGGAQWVMTEEEIPFSMLPEQVQNGFNATEYSSSPWRHDNEAEVLTRNGVETLYVIDVEKKESGVETDVNLYFSEDGILVEEIVDNDKNNDNSGWLPQQPTSDSVVDWIQNKYPGARIVEIDVERGGIEVDIIYNGFKHEVVFSTSNEWIYTKIEYGRRHLDLIDAVVLNALRQSSSYIDDRHIDDISLYDTAQSGRFYCFELETRFDDDVDVYITEDGEVLQGKPSFGGNSGVAVNENIEEFIAGKYPGAVIIERDNDDGYIEVEILHDGKVKEVVFNWQNEWLKTEWELRRNELPQNIIDVITANYDGYYIEDDEIEVIETQSGIFYEVELEGRGRDLKLIINSNGTIEKVMED